MLPLKPNPLYIGIDAGGNRSRLLARSQAQRESFSLEGSGANPNRIGTTAAVSTLSEMIQVATARFPDGVLSGVCVGVAGLGRADQQTGFRTYLRAAVDPQSVARWEVLSDAELALRAAHGNASGLIVIAGTGSIVLGRTRAGEIVRAGGWGYLLGDEGSGYRIGQAALQATALAFDGGTPTLLSRLLNERYSIDGSDSLIRTVYDKGWSMPAVAPLVLEAANRGDTVAQRILEDQTTALAGSVSLLLSRHSDIAPRAFLSGGLTKHGGYTELLRRALLHRHGDLEVKVSSRRSVDAALERAEELGNA